MTQEKIYKKPEKYWIKQQYQQRNNIMKKSNITVTEHISDFSKVPKQYINKKYAQLRQKVNDLMVEIEYNNLEKNGIYKSNNDTIKLHNNLKNRKSHVDSLPLKQFVYIHEVGHAVDFGSYTTNGDMKNLKLVSEYMLYKNNKYSRVDNIENEFKKLSTRIRGYHKIDTTRKRKIIDKKNYDGNKKIKESEHTIYWHYHQGDNKISNINDDMLGWDNVLEKDMLLEFDNNGHKFFRNTNHGYDYIYDGYDFDWSDYRRSPKELFADFISCMVFNPKYTVDVAPNSVLTFEKLMNNAEQYGLNRDQERRMKKVWEISNIKNYY